MPSAILDASAVLALVMREPGSEHVLRHLDGGEISAVNLAEVAGKLVDGGMPIDIARYLLDGLLLNVTDMDRDHAYSAAAIRSLAGGDALSLGDRACLSLGLARGAPVVTADRAWADLSDIDVQLELIR